MKRLIIVMPETLANMLGNIAKQEHRSRNGQIVHLLETAVKVEPQAEPAGE